MIFVWGPSDSSYCCQVSLLAFDHAFKASLAWREGGRPLCVGSSCGVRENPTHEWFSQNGLILGVAGLSAITFVQKRGTFGLKMPRKGIQLLAVG
jgi:hypothetical protein